MGAAGDNAGVTKMVNIPQVWLFAALTVSKTPSDGDDWPKLSKPQHDTVPAIETAQLC